jgi:hypothetical protein
MMYIYDMIEHTVIQYYLSATENRSDCFITLNFLLHIIPLPPFKVHKKRGEKASYLNFKHVRFHLKSGFLNYYR